jgi:uncharacterized membrane protein YqgA involved in biofilm formation
MFGVFQHSAGILMGKIFGHNMEQKFEDTKRGTNIRQICVYYVDVGYILIKMNN